ncbi:uncharacterized protein UV8b_05239 [Ustilaginoidea virens]|uniref:Uncharacterized protein n=1 Tax=Ustilaginoidea virens TaxID=1159556 RepID=A0A8E5HT15_USTVR|nr:uncharacterized protein UV8b_05239 [Ustilaginoidea virens]QUC20998.1 hypothetical protein UV8b_05239 [Ustilaginoidea virens]
MNPILLLLAASVPARSWQTPRGSCTGKGRCCRCTTLNRPDNGQTNCVANKIEAGIKDDNGGGLFFCEIGEPQSWIARMCAGEVYDVCSPTSHFWDRGYDCWDC